MFALGMLLLAATLPARSAPPARPSQKQIAFALEIRPILADKCFKCHGPDGNNRMANLRLDTEEGAFRSLRGSAPFVPGHPEKSSAFLRMTAQNPAQRMPPPTSNRTLTPAQIALIRRWITQGAHWQNHWAFVAPVRPKLPDVQNRAWAKNPIDLFVLSRLEREGLKPSPPASKKTLLRRVTLDLTGLPPTLQEIDAFLADKSSDAYEKVVDRLLASPRFGERMAWDWLDAARYSDTNGYQEDRARSMWPWRDWVVDAFNRNMPFDRFTVEQIAGDLLPNATRDQKIATGFNRNCMLNGEGGRIPEESRVEYVMDRVDTTTTVWLGLTLGCAKCHDHKYDPFTQKEYYQLYAYFNNVPETGAVDHDGSANPVLSLPTPDQEARIAALEKSIPELEKRKAEMEAKLRAEQPEWERKARAESASLPPDLAAILKLDPAARSKEQAQKLISLYFALTPEYADLQKRLDGEHKALNEVKNAVLVTMVMEERKEPRETFTLIRGAYDKPGVKVLCGTPSTLPPLPNDAPKNRLGFAQWLVAPSNPLTARVAVNRYWQMLFGMGLVKTTEDFGVQGTRPVHPELLDWLATEFVRTNWDVKALLKCIVMSATYRQSARVTPALLEKDPDNLLLARGPRYRLPAFMLRDQALALSGLLVEKRGGPPVKPYQPEGVWEDFSYGKIVYTQDHGESLYRRSLYIFWRRSVAPTELFDSASRRVCIVRLERTNTPMQALTLLNDTTFVEAARVFAERVMKQGGQTPAERITTAFRMATSRLPTAKELAILTAGLERYRTRYQADSAAAEKLLRVGEWKRDPALDVTELAAYTSLCSLILNLDETLSKE